MNHITITIFFQQLFELQVCKVFVTCLDQDFQIKKSRSQRYECHMKINLLIR